MKILIFGAGSIGVYLGTLLFAKGHQVTLLGRKKLKKINDTIIINHKSYKVPLRTYVTPKNKTYDVVFITSKLPDLENNLKSIEQNKIKCQTIVPIMNGLVDENIYKKYIADKEFTSISIFEGFRLLENQLLFSPSKIGWQTGRDKISKNISKLLRNANINCKSSAKLKRLQSEKLVMNCAVNALSAVEKKTFHELCLLPETKERVIQLFNESYDILSTNVKMSSKKRLLKRFFKIIEPMTHYSSTYQDAISKKKSEIKFINGFILKLGRKQKKVTSKNKQIINQFRKMFPKSI